jgi:bifunctional DNA-binding transcriptional regulator/antitoxin component of YhaV-PrlF toxin-antitoxin module
MTTSLTAKNRITVPAEIVKVLRLESGTQFEWEMGYRPNKLVVTIKPTRKQRLERIRELGQKWKAGNPIENLICERVQADIDEAMQPKVLPK